MTAGVYRIRNRVTGMAYVGSTVALEQRIKQHLRKLRRGVHANGRLQNAWQADGASAFVFGLLETTPATNEALLEAETRWMAILRAQGLVLYNRWSAKQGRCRPFSRFVELESDR